LKSWLFQASIFNCLSCVHNCNDHRLTWELSFPRPSFSELIENLTEKLLTMMQGMTVIAFFPSEETCKYYV